MIHMNTKISTIMMVLKQPLYGLIAIVTSIGLGLLYYYSTISLLSFSAVAEMIGPAYLIASVGLTFAVAILAGVNVSLAIFKIKGSTLINLKKSGGSTAFGSTLTVFTPGCPACTTALTAVLAGVGGLSIFPLLGLEFKILSMGALIFSIYWITRKLNQPSTCKIK